MCIYRTDIDDLYQAGIENYCKEELADEKVIDVDSISDETKKQYYHDLLDELRHDDRLWQEEDGNFYCVRKDMLNIEKDYGIIMINPDDMEE